MINPSMKVRDVAVDLPHSTSVLERLRIDYCCGGDRPLGEACAAAGVKIEKLERLLEEAQAATLQLGAPNFQDASLNELITYILDKHHTYTNDTMERLGPLVDKVIAAHGENHRELAQIGELFQRLCSDLRSHMFKEEQILFPYVRQIENAVLQQTAVPFAPFGTVVNPIRMMMGEHDVAGEILSTIRSLSSNYTVPEDGCSSYQNLYRAIDEFEQDLHQHIHLENNILFPRAIDMEASAYDQL